MTKEKPKKALSKTDAPDVWSLFSALAELSLTLAGVPAPLIAFAKFADSVGDIGAKQIAKLSEAEDRPAEGIAAAPIEPVQARPLNLKAMLDALGIRAVELDGRALVALLEAREFKAEETAIHLCDRANGSSVSGWFPGEWTKIRVLDEAKLAIKKDPGGVSASINFGPVKLKGKYATNFELTVSGKKGGEAASRISVDLAGALAPREKLRITMTHERDLQRQLRDSGIRLAKGSKLAGFVIKIVRHLENDSSKDYTRKCVLVLEGET